MEGLGRVVVGSAVGGLLGATIFFTAEGLSPKPANAKSITLRCTISEWIIKIGYEHDGTRKTENRDTSDTGPVFINVNKDLMTATVDGKTYAVTADPEKLFLSAYSIENGVRNTKKWQINRSTLEYQSRYLLLGGALGIHSQDAKGKCVKVQVPTGTQI